MSWASPALEVLGRQRAGESEYKVSPSASATYGPKRCLKLPIHRSHEIYTKYIESHILTVTKLQ